ncbi:FIG01060185: hypothetical protein [hydrothermal vent metagenome]|uniref:Uncharacterized protein n=1 Tax=hydrothermal vent metagenome TaxID=652676 RepID=A0A3B0XVE8_9ZZZZ
MSLHNLVTVNTHYTRSVNLERDSDSVDVVSAYIPTSRALRTFLRISEAFGNETTPRAWSLIGPYGSGKSSFSVFLSQLLSCPDEGAAQAARKVLKTTDTKLANTFLKETKNSDGYLKVLITGAPESMSKRLIKGLAETAQNYLGKKPAIVNKLNRALNEELSTTEIISLFGQLQITLKKKRCKGILLIIDELGKFLEYEARHYGANDIYLLQALAEHACKGSDTNLFLFVMLHQSFEQYAKGLGENLKNEWSKVQGRFEDVPFLESAEQVLRVVSAAFNHDLTKQQSKELKDKSAKVVDVLIKQKAISSTLERNDAIDLYSSCYPLHPISAVLLPLLCQKIAQNERTLFSYLGSHEEFGLQFMLTQLEELGEYIYPHHIYDYFITNQPAALGDYATHRRWAEVVTSIERLGDAPETQINILKTIGILNIIGSKGGFKASKPLLETCLPKKKMVKSALSSLEEKSIINYRKFNTEYRVWQGSDFDLEAALQEELNNVGYFSLASELNAAKNMQPLVARKYTIQTGALRYFIPTFIDAKSYKTTEVKSKYARIMFYLAADQDDEKIFKNDVINYFSELDVVALSLNGSQLREAVAENLALKRVGISRQELNSDPVAKREYEDRLTAAEQAEDQMLQDLIAYPTECNWYHKGIMQLVASKRAMQAMLSGVLENVYEYTPNIYNELVNRDKPSAQASAGRNKLLLAMQNHASEENLGIEKFPPEKSIYRAVLKEAGLHRYNEKLAQWELCAPSLDGRKDKKSNMRHVWKRIDAFLDSTEKQPKSLAELNAELLAPPYGVKAGLLPIFYVAVYIVYQHELALYESRRYKPYFTEEMLERFVKRPDEFEFQRFKITGLRASIFEQYSKVIFEDTKKRTLLDLAKPLVSFMSGLPEYTHKTRRGLKLEAIKVRSAFKLAKSPEVLLFEGLPEALGFSEISSNASQKTLESFSQKLTENLRELRDAHNHLLEKQKELLAQAFNIDPNLSLGEIRKIVAGNCYGLDNYTVDTKGLRAFIMRLIKTSGTDDEWFENILMFLGNKPSKKWQDSDQDIAEYRLTDYSRRVIDLEKLRLHEKDRSAKVSGDFDVYLLRSIKKGGEIHDEVVAIDQRNQSQVLKAKEEILEILKNLPDKELELGALAETVDEFLGLYHHKKSSDDKKSKPKSKLKKVGKA